MATRNNSTLSQSDYKRFFGEGLTFDDVLLMPAYSQVLPPLRRFKKPPKSVELTTLSMTSLSFVGSASGTGTCARNR